MKPQVWAEMPPEPCLEISLPIHGGFALLVWIPSHGNPKGRQQLPRGHILLVLKGPVVSSSVQSGGRAAECSELQTCLPSSLRFSALTRCGGQEGDCRRAWDAHLPPVHRKLRAWAAGGTRDPDGERISPSFWWQISHFQG